LFIAGLILLSAGLVFYFITLRSLISGLRQTSLMTKGGYYLCRHPLYSSFILFILPAIALMLNSWLVLTSSIVAYIVFKLTINREDQILESVFGDEYLKYRNKTPELFPFPFRKIVRPMK
jgi:protein-S-isoprenylcysteine O-methyltransferase Ste14